MAGNTAATPAPTRLLDSRPNARRLPNLRNTVRDPVLRPSLDSIDHAQTSHIPFKPPAPGRLLCLVPQNRTAARCSWRRFQIFYLIPFILRQKHTRRHTLFVLSVLCLSSGEDSSSRSKLMQTARACQYAACLFDAFSNVVSALICAGAVPQQPPIMFTSVPSRASLLAISSGEM